MAIPSGGGARSSSPAAPTTYPILTQAVPNTPTSQPVAATNPLNAQAAALARGTIADQVAAIQAQQAADRAAAAATAKQIGQASQAAAGFLGPGGYNLGGLSSQDYANAIAQTGGLASGYTGQLRDDLAAQAAAAQNTLRSIPGNEQTVTNRGGDLANALYGLRGSLPGQGLAAEGLAATTTARLLPAQLLATGQNEALGVLGAGRADAARLDPQLTAARGSLGKLTQTYLGDLVSQQQKNVALNQGQERIDQAAATQQANTVYRNAYLQHLQAGDTERVAHDRASEAAGLTYHDALIALSQGRLAVSQAGVATSRYNAQTARINANKPTAAQGPTGSPRFDSTNSNTNKYRSDQYGNPLGGKITPLPGYKKDKAGTGVVSTSASSRGGPSPPSAQDLQKDIAAINLGLTRAVNGYDVPATSTTPAVHHPALSREDALAELHAAGWFATPQLAKIALKAWKRAYPKPGRGSKQNLFGAAGQAATTNILAP